MTQHAEDWLPENRHIALRAWWEEFRDAIVRELTDIDDRAYWDGHEVACDLYDDIRRDVDHEHSDPTATAQICLHEWLEELEYVS